MTTNLQEVADQALNLLPVERIDLVERLLESVDDFVGPEIEEHWRGIAIRRLAEHETGIVSGIPADRVHDQIRKALNENRLSS